MNACSCACACLAHVPHLDADCRPCSWNVSRTLRRNLADVAQKISHSHIFVILKSYDLPKNLVSAISLTFKAKVSSPDGDSDFFKISAGVMQGDTLAPFLFVFVFALSHLIFPSKELQLHLLPTSSQGQWSPGFAFRRPFYLFVRSVIFL